ncbi:hypothetical protein HME9302_00741 [Alteripontixanthobacter maritimus]|uniref:Protease n=1 Tax=Alteripontixanthobacter maritimus TaxID=2161824 RepID=A0A369Q3U3_9SPHN|nr:serine protease [Alteripontixanthobacter maritimus]RDC59551.1 hypothetical protein HME9302_00741 [Alteripontixanthobacter maritimus]
MIRLVIAIASLLALLLPGSVSADPADVAASARGVVRVVIVGSDGEESFPISHGSGFAISANRIVTNSHVIEEARNDETLRIAIIPSEGDEVSSARILAVSPRNDLALLELTGGLRLPRLTIAGGAGQDSGEVSAIGYPMNVDRAQGLDIGDVLKSQPPVKSRGFLSGARPSRQFDTILHTAPIARGNSGGPLVDSCGRVLGVNSFGADSNGSDAEFFFAISMRELLPFLRENGVQPAVNSLPCRSLADLDDEERQRLAREQEQARAAMSARTSEARDKRERARLEAEMAVMEEREDIMALCAVLLLIGFGAALFAWSARQKAMSVDDYAEDDDDAAALGWFTNERLFAIAALIAAAAFVAALALWFSRPGLAEIDRRVDAAMRDGEAPDTTGQQNPIAGTYLCSIDVARSRITGAQSEDLTLEWSADGCVNSRTQYGFAKGEWNRVFVPNDEDAVSVNSFDPQSGTYRSERYLLSRSQMARARRERGGYTAPGCETPDAAASLGEKQEAVLGLLPGRPNERLVYKCELRR